MWTIKLQRDHDKLYNIEIIEINSKEEPTFTYCKYMNDRTIYHGTLYEIVNDKEEYRAGFCNGR